MVIALPKLHSSKLSDKYFHKYTQLKPNTDKRSENINVCNFKLYG